MSHRRKQAKHTTQSAKPQCTDAVRRAFAQGVARYSRISSSPGPAVRAFLGAANPFAPEPQALLKALALLLAVPAAPAGGNDEEVVKAASFRAQLLSGIAVAVEGFAYERLLLAAAAPESGAALGGLMEALSRCDLLAHQEPTATQAAKATSPEQPGPDDAAPPVPLSRLLLDATRGAWRRLSRAQALRLALQLAQASDAALDPYSFSAAGQEEAASAWRERVAALGAVVGRLGCGRDMVRPFVLILRVQSVDELLMAQLIHVPSPFSLFFGFTPQVYFYEQLLAQRLLQGRTRGAEAEEWALDAMGLSTVRSFVCNLQPAWCWHHRPGSSPTAQQTNEHPPGALHRRAGHAGRRTGLACPVGRLPRPGAHGGRG